MEEFYVKTSNMNNNEDEKMGEVKITNKRALVEEKRILK